jgi:hypothetical protein
MKKFMISFTHAKGDWPDRVPRWNELTDEDKKGLMSQHKALNEALKTEYNTSMVFFDKPQNARTVRLDRDGNMTVTDGPLLNDKEIVGGYFIFEAESMDEAIDLAKRGRYLVGSNEVREIVDINA